MSRYFSAGRRPGCWSAGSIRSILSPTCTARQLETLFGPVDFFVTESREYKIATIFGMERGGLTVKEIDLASEMKSSDLPQIAARSQERDIQTIV